MAYEVLAESWKSARCLKRLDVGELLDICGSYFPVLWYFVCAARGRKQRVPQLNVWFMALDYVRMAIENLSYPSRARPWGADNKDNVLRFGHGGLAEFGRDRSQGHLHGP